MFRVSSSVFFRLNAVALATCLASVSFAPLAHAQSHRAGKKVTASAGVDAATGQDEKPAEAPKPDKKTRALARKAYSDGEKAYAKGDYAKAYDNFNKALELIPSPHAEYWAAMTLDKQDRTNDAIAAYERFLADPGAGKLGEERVSQAKTRLEALRAKLVGEVSVVTTPEGATVSVDGNPEPGITPLSVKLSPGPHKLTVSLAYHVSQDVELNVNAGDKSEQKIALVAEAPREVPAPAPVATPEPAPAPAPVAPAAPPEKRSKVPAAVTLGLAGAGAVVGTVFGIKALSAKKDYDDHPTSNKADDVERNALIADMAFGVAITLGVTGIVLLTTADSTPASETATRHVKPQQAKLNVAPYFSQHGGGAAARWSF